MAFKDMDWDYSDYRGSGTEYVKVTPGEKNLFIEDASFDPEKQQYTIKLSNIALPAEKITLNYWLTTADENNNIIKNEKSCGTLQTLRYALSGEPAEEHGLPAPAAIIGGVVRAEVKMSKPNTSGAQYPRIYKFEPAAAQVVEDNSLIEQYAL